MISRSKRMAGQALAALPEENITEKLSSALQRLREVSTGEIEGDGYGYIGIRNYPVKGETNTVEWATAPRDPRVAFGPDGYDFFDGEFTVGNAAELKRIEDAGVKDVLEVAWHSPEIEDRPGIPDASTRRSLTDTQNTPKGIAKAYQLQDKRTALQARSSWSDYLKTIPDDVLLHNRPIGGLSGEYGRADLYMREGFGPVGENGAQYAIKRNGKLEPVAPMGTHPDYAKHLSKRLESSGEEALADSITNELQRRQVKRDTLISEEQLEYETRPERRYNDSDYERGDFDEPDDYYPDYDNDDVYMAPTQQELQLQAERDYRNRMVARNHEDVRAIGDDLSRAGVINGEYVEGLRNRQLVIAEQQLAAGRDNMDFINSRIPRALPQPITSSPYAPQPTALERQRGSFGERTGGAQFYDNVDQLASDIRTNNARNMPEANPERLRGFAKQRFVRPTMRADGVLEVRENYGPNEVQLLRDLQVQQALNARPERYYRGQMGVSTPMDMLASDVPVQWMTRGGQARGPATPITGAAGTERSLVMRQSNVGDGPGSVLDNYRQERLLNSFAEEAGSDVNRLFPNRRQSSPNDHDLML